MDPNTIKNQKANSDIINGLLEYTNLSERSYRSRSVRIGDPKFPGAAHFQAPAQPAHLTHDIFKKNIYILHNHLWPYLFLTIYRFSIFWKSVYSLLSFTSWPHMSLPPLQNSRCLLCVCARVQVSMISMKHRFSNIFFKQTPNINGRQELKEYDQPNN